MMQEIVSINALTCPSKKAWSGAVFWLSSTAKILSAVGNGLPQAVTVVDSPSGLV
jgi:hypothetical protein